MRPSLLDTRHQCTDQTQNQYRFYDSLIVASALQSGARILYSEDLQAGRRFGDLKIQNPFA